MHPCVHAHVRPLMCMARAGLAQVGSLQPIGEIAARLAAAHPTVLVHTDAAQSIGKVVLQVGVHAHV